MVSGSTPACQAYRSAAEMEYFRSSATWEVTSHSNAGGRPAGPEHNYEVERLQPQQGCFCRGERPYRPCYQEQRSSSTRRWLRFCKCTLSARERVDSVFDCDSEITVAIQE
jgi:hypothetical protein